MSDAIAYLSRAIEQGQGLAEADIVLKGGRIFDLVAGELIESDVAICNDRIVGTLGEYRGRARDRRARQDRGSRLHRHPLPRRVLAAHAARIRPLRLEPRRDDLDLRSARDRQRARANGPALLPRRRDADGDGPARAAVELRAGDGARDLRRAAGSRRSSAARRSSQGAGAGGIHELPRPPGARSIVSRQARGVPDPADRRAQPAARRLRAQRLLERRRAHRPRGHQPARGHEKLAKGMQLLDPRRLGVQGPARA